MEQSSDFLFSCSHLIPRLAILSGEERAVFFSSLPKVGLRLESSVAIGYFRSKEVEAFRQT
jgi:hypothetical protein